ncbi:Phosphoenolpyruvate carboxylase [Durusdinium trenchii]|uniref:Phosphoenolpyruvate carboxylase n=2 Tax=Durusdinium trenchii TaxID=1381693 RepID=A0ABP0HU30_9DINO
MPVSRPRTMEDWLYVLPDCVSSESWTVATSQPKAQLLHRPCPWGGHLVKFDLKRIEIADAPENTANLIVRPEVRAAMSGMCAPGISGFQGSHTTIRSSEFVAPGEAIIESKTSSWLMHLCAVLFGEMSGKKLTHFFHDPQVPVVLHQKIRRNYPSEGDSAVAIWEEGGEVQEGFLLIRPDSEKGKFNVMFVMRILEGNFAPWATFQFRLLMEGAHRSTQFFLNRPNIRELREIDEKFYVTLSIQSFKRGLPMVPCSSKPTVTIDAGERLGLKLWRRYKTERRGAAGSKGKFFLSEYLTILVNALGEDIETFDTLDGLEVVPYQCIVRRSDWERVRMRFFDIYPLAKAAYRRANGGTYAPSVHEEVETKFNLQEPKRIEEEESLDMPKLVVRNTFLDLEEDDTQDPADRPKRRTRSAKLFPVELSVAEFA